MTQYYTYGRIIIRCTLFLREVSQIHIHLTYILMSYCVFLKVNQYKTFQYPMIEHQINMIMSIVYCNVILPAYESKSLSQFQQKYLQIIYYSLL